MNAVLYIEIIDGVVYPYTKPILEYVRYSFPDTIVFDFDSLSDAVTAGYAMKVFEQAQKVALILQLREGSIGALLSVLEKVVSSPEKCLVWVNGSNQMVERMLTVLDIQRVRRGLPEKLQQEEISNYLSAI